MASRTNRDGPPVHSAAELFPLMADDELRALADDIKANGLRQPVVLDGEGRVLDGRNRLAACKLADVEPQFTSVNGDDPVALVVSLNVKRRNLTKAQTAIAAAEACRIFDTSARTVAQLFGVHHSYVSQARALVERDPFGANAVKSGAAVLKDTYEDLMRREGKVRGESAERAKLRERFPDLAESVEQEVLELREALAQAERRTAERKQLRWAATMNIIDGLAHLDRPAHPEAISEIASLLDPEQAAQRGEKITPERLRRAASFASALGDALEGTDGEAQVSA